MLGESFSELRRETDVIESQKEVAIIRNLMLIPPLWRLAVNYLDSGSLPFFIEMTHSGQLICSFSQVMFLDEIFELMDIHLIITIVWLLYFIPNSNISTSMFISTISL